MKKIAVILVIVLAVILLFPVRLQLKDGGSVEYKAIVYSVKKEHSFASPEEEATGKEFNEGIIIKIFGQEIYNNVK